MLMQRVITAIVLIPPVVAAVWFLPTMVIAGLLAAFFLVGAWEWSQFMRLAGQSQRVVYVVFIAAALAAMYALRDMPQPGLAVLGAATAWWVLALVWVTQYPAGLAGQDDRRGLKALIGLLVLAPAFLALVVLHGRSHGALWILFLLVLIWAADTGAYFSGRAFGKNKLAVRVSPGKTWEGAAGGLALSVLVASLAGHWLFNLVNGELASFIALCAAVVIFSIVGDLTESMFKRQSGVKDSGTLFPGHGGVLDRLDSLFAAAPLFLAGLILLGI